jgi:hypothetical protein
MAMVQMETLMNIRKLVLSSTINGLAMVMVGCAGASNATDSTVSYIRGDQHATLGATPPQIADATLAAATELELPVDSHAADGLVGKILMHTSDGTKVEVNIKGEVNDQSQVIVRVGTFGDKALQQRVLDKIKSHLSATTMPTVALPTMSSPPPAPAAAPTLAQTPTPTPSPTPAPSPAPTPAPNPTPSPTPTPTPTPAPPSLPAPPSAAAPAPAASSPPPVNPLAPAAAPATAPGGF